MSDTTSLAMSWVSFLAQVDEAREYVYCSNSPVWFRGHSDSSWPLTPSLMRFGAREDADDEDEIRRRQNEVSQLRQQWQETLKEKTAFKKMVPRESDDPDFGNYRAIYHQASKDADSLKQKMIERKQALLRFMAPVGGERELFDEFVFRAGKSHHESSWEILAEMRHHGVPTRLLDWTDRLDIALYFALENYRFLNTGNRQGLLTANVPTPCIWVLNPYLLSKRVTGRTSIWDIAREKSYDYYDRVLVNKEWPFDRPIPTYPPARIERIRSQRGYFIVFGNEKRAMDEQIAGGIRCLRRIELTPETAIFCLQYLSSVQGLSKFEVYRDLDSLGQELAGRFINMHARPVKHR